MNCILFDFGDTLVDERIFINEAYKNAVSYISRYYSLNLNLNESITSFSFILQNKMRELNNASPKYKEVLARREAIKEFILSFRIIPRIEEIDLIFKSLVKGAIYSDSLFPETIETLQRLKDLNLKIGIVSNGLAEYTRNFIREHKMLEYFDTIVISEEVNIEKPDINIFRMALDSLGCTSKESVMIGNKLYEDILGAKNTEIKAIWINRRNIKNDCRIIPDYTIDNLLKIFEILNCLKES